MLKITDKINIPDDEIELIAIRAQGAGGQNVNKVSSAIHLRFNVQGSSLPDAVKRRLLAKHDRRITADGVIIIKLRITERRRKTGLTHCRDVLSWSGVLYMCPASGFLRGLVRLLSKGAWMLKRSGGI